jgi:DNA-binding IclR family transcriptional regulator
VTVRRTGTAFQRDQVNLGLGAIAAPVLIKGHPVGAVAVQFETEHGYKAPIADAVRITASRIAKETIEVLDDGHADWYPFER